MLKRLLSLFLILVLTGCSYHQRNSHRVVSVTPGDTTAHNKKNFQYSQQAYGGIYTLDPSLTQYVNQLARKCIQNSIHPNLKCEVVIVNSSIPNIWSFQEGYIALTRGLLSELENEAELVAILCHEISHINAQDGKTNIQKIILNAGPIKLDVHTNYYVSDFAVGPLGSGSGLITLKYDTHAEVKADQASLDQMHQMGYDSQALVNFHRRIQVYKMNQDPNWLGGYLAKHPVCDFQLDKCKHSHNLMTHSGVYKSSVFNEHLSTLKGQKEAYEKLDLGYRALLNKKFDKAIKIAIQGLALEPRETHFLLLKAKAEASLGHMATALQTLNHAIKQNPYYFDLYLQRGLVKEQLDDWVEACNDLERSLALLPTAEAYYALGEIDYSIDRQAEAIEYFRKASISASPGGKKAQAKLKRLGLPVSGVQTIEVTPSFTETGHLNLEVQNKGNKIASSIVVNVEQISPKGKLLFRHLIEIKKNLSPNEIVCQQTNIGPFFSKEHMDQSTQVFPVYCE